MTIVNLQAKCDAWNAEHPIGTVVRYFPSPRDDMRRVAETSSEAQVLAGGHLAGVYLREWGFVALSRIEPVKRVRGDELVRRLIELRNRKVPWTDCAQQLGTGVDKLHALAAELRDAGKWKLPNGRRARGATMAGQPRPKPKPRSKSAAPTVGVSLRLAPDVAAALNEYASACNVRLGLVIDEAMRAVVDKRDPTTCTYNWGRQVLIGPRSKAVSVRVPDYTYDAFTAIGEGRTLTRIAAACEQLLKDLGCEMVKP